MPNIYLILLPLALKCIVVKKYIQCSFHAVHVNYNNEPRLANLSSRELVALLNLSSWCLVMVERLFFAVPRGCQRFVIVVFPDHTHYFRLC